LQLFEGKCPITTECLLFLSRKSSSWWLTEQGRDVPVQAVNSKARLDARGHGPSIRTTAGPKATASFSLHRFILWCVLLQVIMTTADTPAPKEAITAALLVIGDKILSGRTKDQNIGYVAEYLTALGMHLAEVRVIGDEETAIVDASMRSGSATAMSSPLPALGRPMTTSPPTAWPRRLECRSTSIRARSPSWASGWK
jgi:hypothetical protein